MSGGDAGRRTKVDNKAIFFTTHPNKILFDPAQKTYRPVIYTGLGLGSGLPTKPTATVQHPNATKLLGI